MSARRAGPFFIFASVTAIIFFSFRGTSNPDSKRVSDLTQSASSHPSPGSKFSRIHPRLEGVLSAGPVADWAFTQPVFNPGKLAVNANYRRVVWGYWLHRNLEGSLANEPKLESLRMLCRSNGVQELFMPEIIRAIYADLSDIQRFEGFAREANEIRNKQIAKVLQAVGPSEEQKNREIAQIERVASVSEAQWLSRANLLKTISISKLRRETGIEDDSFYNAVFAVRFSERGLATAIETDMADNEAVLDW